MGGVASGGKYICRGDYIGYGFGVKYRDNGGI